VQNIQSHNKLHKPQPNKNVQHWGENICLTHNM